MNSDPWTPAEEALLKALVEQGLNDTEVIAKFREAGIERSAKAIERKRERLNLHAQVAVSPKKRFDKPLRITGDTLVICDSHCPYHDATLINRVVALALRWGIRKCAVVGDAVDFDAFSSYGPQVETQAEEEIQVTAQMFNALATNFDEVGYCPGGHEFRLVRAAGHKLTIERIMSMFVERDNVHTTDYEWMEVESGGQLFRVVHPGACSVHATIVPKELCSTYRCHILCAHGHVAGWARDRSDSWFGVDCGIVADPLRLAYAVKRMSRRPKMQQGAVVIKDGIPVLLLPSNLAFYERL